MTTPLTGRKVFFIVFSAFAVIIAVNLTMAFKAVSTFPGLEVKNSYVASQTFDAERSAQLALGWTLESAYEPGILRLDFRDSAGLPVEVESLRATVGRTTMSAQDIEAEFAFRGDSHIAPMLLEPGKWMVRLEAFSPEGVRFHQRIDLFVKG